MTATNATTHINTLQVRGAVANTPALRLRLSSLLGSADLRPPGFSPAAVLIVRRIADPLPGRALTRRGGTMDRAWTRAAREALTTLYRQAARPMQGPVSTTAEAVLFADKAELLACLARDIIQGRAGSCWWWRGMLRGAPATAPVLVELFCREARALPAALYKLAQTGEAAPLLAALSPTQAIRVLTAVSQVYGTTGIPAALLAAPPARQPAATSTASAPASSTAAPFISINTAPPAHAPWETLLPPALLPRSIQREHAALLGVALTLAVRPTVARAPAFPRQLAAWWAAGAPVSTTRQPAPALASTKAPASDAPVPGEAYAADIDAGSSQQAAQDEHTTPSIAAPDHPDEEGTIHPPQQPAPPAASVSGHSNAAEAAQAPQQPVRPEHPASPTAADQPISPNTGEDTPATYAAQPADTPDTTPARPAEPTSKQHPAHPLPPESQTLAPDPYAPAEPLAPDPEPLSTTELGGVFFLINLMLHLDLPECFEPDWSLESQIGPWGALELLARGMLARHSTAWQADPLWDTLAALDGRLPGTLPGEHFSHHPNYDIPPGWLKQPGCHPGTRCFWSSNNQRVCLWSEQGFVLHEGHDATPDPARAARDRLHICLEEPDTIELVQAAATDAPIDALTGPLLDRLNPQLSRWLALVLPFIERRLRLALGTEAAQTVEALLLRRGQLFLTSMHLDLVMPMSAVTLPVRVSGLDRDPGWLPTFGRIIRLHFEE
jgi:hypothetical protein